MNAMTLPQPTETVGGFTDRRQSGATRSDGPERRQFRDTRDSYHPDARELANAIDSYKLTHRRRFITYEELFDVISSLGYHKGE